MSGSPDLAARAMPPEPAPPKLERAPLLTVTKAEAVYLETRARILTGVLPPGLEVNQEALAADLGVSITPLREALRRLEMEGLIRLEAHRTVFITPLTSRELDELYVIRMELDSLAAGLAATKAPDAQLTLIGQLARRKPVRDPVAQLERNRAFHRAIYGACDNAALITYLDQLWDRTDRYRLILVKEELIGGYPPAQEHIEIADAVAARRSELAAHLTRDHIARSRTRIAEFMASRGPIEATAALPGRAR
jgi:DNA-binding GntR family transcriptional regulator